MEKEVGEVREIPYKPKQMSGKTAPKERER